MDGDGLLRDVDGCELQDEARTSSATRPKVAEECLLDLSMPNRHPIFV